MHQQHNNANDVAFSAYSADTEDYFAFLPSDESMSDAEDAPASPVAKNLDVVDELASVFASSSSIRAPSKVLTPIGSLNGSNSTHKAVKKTREQVKTLAPGVFDLGGGEELKVSPQALERHNARRTQLQEALDAATGGTMSDAEYGEAPFRFMTQHKRVVRFADEMEVEMVSASPSPVEKEKHLGRRRSAVKSEEDDEDEDNETVELDPLYDEQLDDADEDWVQTNLRGTQAVKPETDATLCCPCCFVTVCMVCERHATYTNQYRSTSAINCRVKKDEILTYTSNVGSRVPASLPFHKRQNLAGGDSKSTTTGQQIARLLQEDEFYPVACSDCSTMVGVFDRDQQYHFFNALPSNC
ncbi:Signal transduction response regulator, receiver domain containing hypothetical protein [Phytophthora palmivora]|uniref:E2F-associated phosphoprotein n=1 Tax=Phytophthora palmivora TaxID=4796 RepID=A0A2P4YKJ9_9STRA|nr:Signal transduction response regulator, receiver domain containing hypothetical protein [Phytophthora palmivora]